MALINMAELRRGLGRGQRVVGLDPGARVIGVALSDVGLMLASPWGAWARGKVRAVAAALGALAAQEGVGGLVIGLPLSMDGSFGPAAQGARDWALALTEASGLPGAMWDERLSSAAVNRMLIDEMDVGRRRRAAVVDGLAAAYMLQGALDATAPGAGA